MFTIDYFPYVEENLKKAKEEFKQLKKQIEELEKDNANLRKDVERLDDCDFKLKRFIESEVRAKGKKVVCYEDNKDTLVPMIEENDVLVPFYFSRESEEK